MLPKCVGTAREAIPPHFARPIRPNLPGCYASKVSNPPKSTPSVNAARAPSCRNEGFPRNKLALFDTSGLFPILFLISPFGQPVPWNPRQIPHFHPEVSPKPCRPDPNKNRHVLSRDPTFLVLAKNFLRAKTVPGFSGR